jgi:Domain of unknown function (DUF4190)
MTDPTPYTAPVGAPAAKWNVLSIVSLVTSIIGLGLVGVITGHIALGQIKKTGEQGNVLAIIGLILGYLGIIASIIFGIAYIALLAGSGAVGFSTY